MMHSNNKYGHYENDRVRVQISDSEDGVFVTVDFRTLENGDTPDNLGYRLWAANDNDTVKVEVYEYYNQTNSVFTFPNHRLAD